MPNYGDNATRWYCTRSDVKRAANLSGTADDQLIDSYCAAASSDVERDLLRNFIPITATYYYRWPRQRANSYILYLEDEDVLTVSQLQVRAQDSSPDTILAANYYLEPANSGPPYSRIEINLGSTAAFYAGVSPQRSIGVTGTWGRGNTTVAAGTLRTVGGINASVTTMLCSDGSLVDVGHTVLCGTEAIFVSGKSWAAEENGDQLGGALTADMSVVSVPVGVGSRYNIHESILIDSEEMLLTGIVGNTLTVQRSFNGSVLAAHNQTTAISVYRTLTVVRGVNGTTAATHAQTAALSVYAPPGDIVDLTRAIALEHLKQGQSGWTGQIGGAEGAVQFANRGHYDLYYLRLRAREKHGRVSI